MIIIITVIPRLQLIPYNRKDVLINLNGLDFFKRIK